jgi:adenylate cyclase
MAVEIERKFLVAGDGWRTLATGRRGLRQGYLSRGGQANVRVRIADGASARLTIKAAQGGAQRSEFEYEIPLEDAEELLRLAEGAIIEKVRHIVPIGGLVWEIDEFAGDNEGLVLAEVELSRADQEIEVPDWIGREVTAERAYYNASLVESPFRLWRDTPAPGPPEPAAKKAAGPAN